MYRNFWDIEFLEARALREIFFCPHKIIFSECIESNGRKNKIAALVVCVSEAASIAKNPEHEVLDSIVKKTGELLA